MLLEKLQEHKNFTAHEKDVAEYILSHLDQISELSAGELAKASYTSKATVVRLSQKLGLNGFQDLKITLTAEINQKKRIDQLLANEPVTAESTYDDIVKTLPALYDKAVTNTRLSLDKNSMKRISQVLQKAECIDIYGTGISYILAQSAAFKISTLGLECSAYESINSHYLAARKHKKNIAFLISLTGSNHTVICMAKYLREATETYVVGIAVAKMLNKFTHIEIGKALTISGLITAMTSIFVYDIPTLIISLLGTYANGAAVDYFIDGFKKRKRVCIIADDYRPIQQYIIHDLNRGATLYTAQGAYDETHRTELITIITQQEYRTLLNYLHSCGQKVFVTVSTVNEVIGQWNSK